MTNDALKIEDGSNVVTYDVKELIEKCDRVFRIYDELVFYIEKKEVTDLANAYVALVDPLEQRLAMYMKLTSDLFHRIEAIEALCAAPKLVAVSSSDENKK